jgi:GT2 family glycosyltransferase
MNEGIQFAMNQGGADYVLAMNDDTHLDLDALQFLVETSQQFPEAIISSLVYDSDDAGEPLSYGGLFGWNRWMPIRKPVGEVGDREILYTEHHTGRGVLFPVSVYERVGLYDDEHFPMKADWDFSYRCLEAGIEQYIDTGAIVYLHRHTTVAGAQRIRFTPREAKKALFHKNGVYNPVYAYWFYRKHFSFWWFWFAAWMIVTLGKVLLRLIPGITDLYLACRDLYTRHAPMLQKSRG